MASKDQDFAKGSHNSGLVVETRFSRVVHHWMPVVCGLQVTLSDFDQAVLRFSWGCHASERVVQWLKDLDQNSRLPNESAYLPEKIKCLTCNLLCFVFPV